MTFPEEGVLEVPLKKNNDFKREGSLRPPLPRFAKLHLKLPFQKIFTKSDILSSLRDICAF